MRGSLTGFGMLSLLSASVLAAAASPIPFAEPEPGSARNRPSGSKPVSGGGSRERARRLARICQTKLAFEEHFRDLRRPDVGDEANGYSELDMVIDLSEDGWPDACGWRTILSRIHDGGEMTPREREQALAYWQAGEELPAEDMRLPPCGPDCQRDEQD